MFEKVLNPWVLRQTGIGALTALAVLASVAASAEDGNTATEVQLGLIGL
ncbi:hypothetical protein SRS16P3_00064 (plasmid) [Variovorax sp. SRS16]|nr:hypothetical protein [Variovorax sp. SRS16]VTU46352.1 hypothetical protein SRS16P3_00064 [Variovorax sp. SRS16]